MPKFRNIAFLESIHNFCFSYNFDALCFLFGYDCDKGFMYYFNGSLHHLDEIACSKIDARGRSCRHAATRVVIFAQL